MIDLVERINAFAAAQGWKSHLGFDDFENNISTMIGYQAGELILTFDAVVRPTYKNGKVISSTGRTKWLLGRKFEAGFATESSLEETHQQKYDRRLSELMGLLVAAIGVFSCENGYTVNSGDLGYIVNMFDTNIDFVGGEITFTA